VTSAYVSPEAALLVTVDDKGGAWTGDLRTSRWLAGLGPTNSRLITATFSEAGDDRIAAYWADGMIRIWAAETGVVESSVNALAVAGGPVTANGESLVAAAPDGGIRIWNALYPDMPRWIVGRPGPRALAADGALVVATDREGVLSLWESNTGYKLGARLDVGPTPLASVYDGDSRQDRIAVADASGHIRTWVVHYPLDAEPLRRYTSVPPGVANPVIRPGNPARTLDPGPGMRHGAPAVAMTYSDDGRYLATASTEGTVRVWTADTGWPVATITGHTEVRGPLDFRDQGRLYVTTADKHAGVRLWQITLS
jgi:WD40 repeat protein